MPLSTTDTIIERLDLVNFGALPDTQQIPIEMVQMDLRSVQPITVTYGGNNPELWAVQLGVSPTQPSLGTMDVTKTDANGGTVDDLELDFHPRFTFTRQSDSAVRIYDTAPYIVPDIAAPLPWAHNCPPPIFGASLEPDPDFCIVFHEFGHAIQDNQVPGYSTQTIRQACTDNDEDGISDCIDPTPDGDIPAGHDLFSARYVASDATHIYFEIPPADPIPAGFFDPGSEPFDGVVGYAGDPLAPGTLGLTDTIIQRMEPANLPPPYPSTDQVPIELVALSLQSVQPITVTYNSGPPELWDVQLGVSTTTPSTGTLDITAEDADSGTMDGDLTIVPRYTFTRQSDSDVRVIDGAPLSVSYDEPGLFIIDVCHPDTVTVPFPQQYYTTPNLCLAQSGIYDVSARWIASSPSVDHPVRQACYDDDSDGRGQCYDNCPADANPLQEDADEDSTGDACDLTPDGDIVPGSDPYETESWDIDFATNPIPPGFFEASASGFGEVIQLAGLPTNPPVAGTTDTVIQRLGPANLPGPLPSTDTVPIELVQLSLVSVSPITVTYPSAPSELWNVSVVLSPNAASTGTMTITKTHANGGTFDSQFFVKPRFTFTRVSDSVMKVLDFPTDGRPALFLDLNNDQEWLGVCGPSIAVPQVAVDFCPGVSGMGRLALDYVGDVQSRARVADVDTDLDGTGDSTDNCPQWPNGAQNLPPWTIQPDDADCDGFRDTTTVGTNGRETYIGTDPLQHCAATAGANNDPEPDAWPADFNDDRIINGQDSGKFGGPFGSYNKMVSQGPFGPPGQELPGERFDFSANGLINGQDTGKYQAYFNKVCTP